MIRKFVIAAAAIATLGTASLAVGTTSANAYGLGFYGYHGYGHGYYGGFRRLGFYAGPAYGGYYDSCLRRKWVINRFGEAVRRTVNICY